MTRRSDEDANATRSEWPLSRILRAAYGSGRAGRVGRGRPRAVVSYRELIIHNLNSVQRSFCPRKSARPPSYVERFKKK